MGGKARGRTEQVNCAERSLQAQKGETFSKILLFVPIKNKKIIDFLNIF